MAIRRHKVIFDASTASTSAWVRLDSRYEVDATRSIQVNVTSGDSIDIEGTSLDIRGEGDPTVGIAAADVSVLATYTEDSTDVLSGNWTYIRAVKTGTTGPGKVQGHV